jgi:hypothetical protein
MMRSVIAAVMSLCLSAVADPILPSPDRFDYVLTTNVQYVINDVFSTNAAVPQERVRVDLSLDGGQTWPLPVAVGIPWTFGTNTLPCSLRVTPAMWTENAKLRVVTLWGATTNTPPTYPGTGYHMGDVSDAPFSICGVRILSPANGATIAAPSYTPITWREAGVPVVHVGYSTNGVDYEFAATVPSLSPTTTWNFPVVPSLRSGPLWILVQAYSNLWDCVQVTVDNLLE